MPEKSSVLLTLTLVRSLCERLCGCAAGIDATDATHGCDSNPDSARHCLRQASPSPGPHNDVRQPRHASPARSEATSSKPSASSRPRARRGDPQLCEAWAAVLDGLAAGGSARRCASSRLCCTTASAGRTCRGRPLQSLRDGRRRPHYHLAMMPWHLSMNRRPKPGFL